MTSAGRQSPPARRLGALAGLSDEGILDAILAAVRAVALEDGVPERIARRGFGQFTVEVQVRDHEIVAVDVGSRATMRKS